jgi:hypothetical protein
MPLSKISGFNPLFSIISNNQFEDLPESILSDSIKGAVQTILSSYTGYFDLFSETIQNALDATEKKAREGIIGYVPQIWIEINMKDASLKVIDNGCGMTLSEFLLCFRPNTTFKKGLNLRGNKGVGATFLAYGYNYVNLQTKHNANSYSAVLRQGRMWIEDEKGKTKSPAYEENTFDVQELLNEKSGTSIEIRLGGKNEKPKDFGYYGAVTAPQWYDLLRITTPLGGVYFETPNPNTIPIINLTVTDKYENVTKIQPQRRVEFYYPHEIPDINEKMLGDVIKEYDKYEGSSQTKEKKVGNEFKNLNVLWDIWNSEEVLKNSKFKFTEEQKTLMQEHNIIVYGAMVDSISTFKAANKAMGLNERSVMKGGLQLATDGMPQGEIITIPLKRYAGYQFTTLIIVHFKKGNPDMGRKTFQPELTELAQELAVKITGIFIEHIEFLRPDTGSEKNLIPDRAKYDWIRRIVNYREISQLNFKSIHQNFSYLCKPQEEQDAVAVFHQLIGCGIIRGLFFYCSEFNDKYDGLIEYNYEDESYFFSNDNPLGVRNDIPLNLPSEPKVVEYKYDFDSILNDITKEKKYFEHLNLVVCWKATGDYTKNLILKSLLLENEGNVRTIYGSTHVGYLPGLYSNHKIEVIVLEELISYILHPEHEIANQKSKYDYK